MNYRRARIYALLCCAAQLAAIAAAGHLAEDALAAPACAEDSRCWTWSAMGNQRRGVTLTDGRRVTVGVCRFARLDARRRIDWQETPRLRGDYLARIHRGC